MGEALVALLGVPYRLAPTLTPSADPTRTGRPCHHVYSSNPTRHWKPTSEKIRLVLWPILFLFIYNPYFVDEHRLVLYHVDTTEHAGTLESTPHPSPSLPFSQRFLSPHESSDKLPVQNESPVECYLLETLQHLSSFMCYHCRVVYRSEFTFLGRRVNEVLLYDGVDQRNSRVSTLEMNKRKS